MNIYCVLYYQPRNPVAYLWVPRILERRISLYHKFIFFLHEKKKYYLAADDKRLVEKVSEGHLEIPHDRDRHSEKKYLIFQRIFMGHVCGLSHVVNGFLHPAERRMVTSVKVKRSFDTCIK